MASKNGIILIEDDPYQEIGFKNVDFPSKSKFDKDGNVVSLGSFSKTLCPGLRVGWMIANEKIIEQVIYAKQVTDVQTSAILYYRNCWKSIYIKAMQSDSK
ncbi:aminotransferase class I/II-fold pyridoxal phosphate-dependent enzyme [Lysinibacillus fusiformis]